MSIKTESLKADHEKDKEEMEGKFMERIQQVKEEFATEITNAKEELMMKHKKELERQWKQLVADKEDALQSMESRHRNRMDEAEHKMRYQY